MNKENVIPRRALLSVSDKENIIEFAKGLVSNNIELISTGGTLQTLQSHNIPVKHVSEITDFPEMMGGRLKTLHPLLLGGILGLRDEHQSQAEEFNIEWVDLVVCNLYPFERVTQSPDVVFSDAIENIDIGGPTMVRAAAKNFPWVAVVCDPNEYDRVLSFINETGLPFAYRKALAKKAFSHTARYDGLIANFLNEDEFPDTLTDSYIKASPLRYGENPHQSACVYKNNTNELSVLNAIQLQGKSLSYNNLVDAQAAIDAISCIDTPAAAVIKHAIPCGMASKETIEQSFIAAFLADEKSAFGGVVALNQACNEKIAFEISKRFVEIVIAPSFSDEAKACLKKKVALRLLTLDMNQAPSKWSKKYLPGGMLLQENDLHMPDRKALEVVAGGAISYEMENELLFAWLAVKQVKSNAIVVSKEGITLGIGGGQVSRVDAVEIALAKSGDKARGAVLASDAFFPFRDSIDLIAKSGVQVIIQPGGSKRDNEVIAAAKEHGITMVFTKHRCFKH